MAEPLPSLEDSPDTYEPTHAAPTRTTRGVGAERHITSVVLGLLLVPVGYGFADYASYRAITDTLQTPETSLLPTTTIVMMGAAAFCMFLAGATARISALGPLVAALVWGAAPTAWVIVDFASFAERIRDLPEAYDNLGFGIVYICFALFPAVGGLLLGGAVAGRWRRPVRSL